MNHYISKDFRSSQFTIFVLNYHCLLSGRKPIVRKDGELRKVPKLSLYRQWKKFTEIFEILQVGTIFMNCSFLGRQNQIMDSVIRVSKSKRDALHSSTVLAKEMWSIHPTVANRPASCATKEVLDNQHNKYIYLEVWCPRQQRWILEGKCQ